MMQRAKLFATVALWSAFLAGSASNVPTIAQIPAKAGAVASAAKAAGPQLDLNTATPEQLKSMPGIGDVYAKRIVDGRPYSAKNQLVTKGILPPAVYEKIKENVVAKRAK